jgi:hypothetical protein
MPWSSMLQTLRRSAYQLVSQRDWRSPLLNGKPSATHVRIVLKVPRASPSTGESDNVKEHSAKDYYLTN